MYSPKELEGEVDHSFFDSDCDEDGQNQHYGNSVSKQQSSGSGLVSDGRRSSTEVSTETDGQNHKQKDQKRGNNKSQVEDAFTDLKEIKKALEVGDWNEESEKRDASYTKSTGPNEEKNGAAGPDSSDEMSKNSTLVEGSTASSQTSSEQRAVDKTLVNDGSDKTVDEIKLWNLEIEGDEIKKDSSLLLNASDGSNIGGKDNSQGLSMSLVGAASLCSSVSLLSSGQERNPAEAKRPRSRSPSDGSEISSVEERDLEDYDDLDDDVLNDLDDDDDGDDDANDDGYQRSEESGGSDEERPPEPPPPKHKPQALLSTPRKSSGKFRKHSPRPSSSSELESSCSSDGEGHSSSSELSLPRRVPAALATSSSRRKLRLGLAASRERVHSTERAMLESEDTVTDVTPLSTPDMSPAQSFDLPVFAVEAEVPAAAAAAAAAWSGEKPKQHNLTIDLNVTTDDGSKRDNSDQEDLFEMDQTQETSSLNQNVRLDEPIDKHSNSDQEVDPGLLRVCPTRECASVRATSAQSNVSSGRQCRNFSFRNDEVWRIDRENQRLLRELSRPSQRSRSGSTAASSAHTASSFGSQRASGPPPPRLYHSTINRQREQKRIERENLAFLKRLEAVKPSKGITRAEQLADYQRQARFLCTPLPTSTIEHYHSRIEASLSRSSQGKSSRLHSAGVRLSPRPGSRPSPAPTKPSRGTVPRPAWS